MERSFCRGAATFVSCVTIYAQSSLGVHRQGCSYEVGAVKEPALHAQRLSCSTYLPFIRQQLHGSTQSFGIEGQIALSGLQALMTQQFLNLTNIRALAQQLSRKRMAQLVRRNCQPGREANAQRYAPCSSLPCLSHRSCRPPPNAGGGTARC